MVIETRHALSLEEFDRLVDLPENADRLFEYIDGEAVEVPSNPFASMLAMRISIKIGIYLESNDIGFLTGADGGYVVNGERYAPDVAYIAYQKQKQLAHKGYNPTPPDLVAEVISDPTNRQELDDLEKKLANYMTAGTIVWVFDWSKKQVEIHTPGEPKRTVGADATLTAESVLPGFALKVSDVLKD